MKQILTTAVLIFGCILMAEAHPKPEDVSRRQEGNSHL